MKNLMKTAAMLVLGLAIVSCTSKDIYDESAADKIKQQQLEKAYTEAFEEAFGPIAEGNDWGFDSSTMTRAAANNNFDQYGDYDFSWIPPGQGKKFIETFNAANTVEGNFVPFEEYFLQQISMQTGHGHGGSGSNAEKVQLERLEAYNYGTGQWEVVPGFSKGMNTSSQTDLQKHTLTKGVSLMANMGEANADHAQFRWVASQNNTVYPQGYACDNYVIKKINNDYYIGFGYTNDNTTQYDAWIVRIVKAEGNPGYKACGRVMCEDLGSLSSSDFDFNDVVFDAYIMNDESINITILAAGGTLRPITVAGVEVELEQMTNTGLQRDDLQSFTIPAAVAKENGWTTIKNIPVEVTAADGTTYKLQANSDGSAPGKICTFIGVDWAKEKQNLDWAYPGFKTYVQTTNPEMWFQNEVKEYTFSLQTYEGLNIE